MDVTIRAEDSLMENCKTVGLLLCILALVSNMAMVTIIWKKHGFKQSSYVVFAFLGLSNALTCILGSSNVAQNELHQQTSFAKEWIIHSLSMFITFLQLEANLILAHNRYLAVSHPLQYRLVKTAKKVKKQILFSSVILFFGSITVNYILISFKQKHLFNSARGTCRLVGSIVLVLIYAKVYKKFKAVQTRVLTGEGCNTLQKAVARLRAKRQLHLFKMCFGIAFSYIIFNSPISIYLYFIAPQDSCRTQGGKVYLSLSMLVLVNIIFDPLWYFFSSKGRRH